MVYWESLSQAEQLRLASLSYDEVCEALEQGDEAIEDAVGLMIDEYAALCAEALSKGEDYLPVLLSIVPVCPMQKVAMEILEEAFEEELES